MATKKKSKPNSKPSIAFTLTMVLVASLFVVAFSGSVSGETRCTRGPSGDVAKCCSGPSLDDLTCDDCSSFGVGDPASDPDCISATKSKIAAVNCASCKAFSTVPGSGGARTFSNETCVDFSKDQNDSLRVDSAANFEELSAGLDAGQSLNLGQGQSNEQLSVRMNEVSGSSGVVNVQSTGQSYEITQGDVFKAGPSGNELVKFKGGSESGNERSAKMEYLGSACEGELRVLGPGDKIPVKEEFMGGFEQDFQQQSEIVNYTIIQGLPPVDFSYGNMKDSEDITDIPMNRIKLEGISFSNSPKVGTSIGGVTILDVTNQNGDPRVIVCICDSNTGDGLVNLDVGPTQRTPEPEIGSSPEVREDRQKKPSGPSESQQGNKGGFLSGIFEGNVVKNVFG